MTSRPRPSVAVVGAGFSGAMTALHLARPFDGPRVHLFDRPGPFGRGAAFASLDPDHLLNVRTANMSAWPDKPDHFANWSARETGQGSEAFSRRADYGRYLQSLLTEKAAGPGALGRLVVTPDDVVAVRSHGAGWRIETGMGRRIPVDAVCLALGNLPPLAPETLDPALVDSPLYVADPWRWTPAQTPQEAESAVLIGSGLTMVDVAISLAANSPTIRITAISRRGLAPLAHEGAPGPPARAPPEGGPAEIARALRRDAKDRGWRSAVDGLRPHVQGVWRSWSTAERASFLRHGRPYWDVHRHRLAPAVAHRLDVLRSAGRLHIEAGEVKALHAAGAQVVADWRPRGGVGGRRSVFDLAINCSGPSGDVTATASPLLRQLMADGRLRPDPLGLGVECDALSRLVGRDGEAATSLFAVGPLTRGAFWEVTAVPDIRVHAEQVASAILAVCK